MSPELRSLNRRVRLLSAALIVQALVTCLVLVMGAAAPLAPDLDVRSLRAQKIVIVNKDDQPRITLSVGITKGEDSGLISILDPLCPRIVLHAKPHQPSIRIFPNWNYQKTTTEENPLIPVVSISDFRDSGVVLVSNMNMKKHVSLSAEAGLMDDK